MSTSIFSIASNETVFLQEMKELQESFVKEAIDFFSEPKNNKTSDCERFFFKRTEWETVVKNCSPELIDPYIIYDECGDVWGFAIRPKFEKKVRLTAKKEVNPEIIKYVEKTWPNQKKQFKTFMAKVCCYHKFTKEEWKDFFNWYKKLTVVYPHERVLIYEVFKQFKHIAKETIEENTNYWFTLSEKDSKTNKEEVYFF